MSVYLANVANYKDLDDAGYKVVRIPWANNGPRAAPNSTNGYETIVGAPDLSRCPSGCIRPVALAFDRLGRLFVSSDTTGEVGS